MPNDADEQLDMFGKPPAPLRKTTRARRGHAWPSGSGPPGETCGGCASFVRKHRARTYFKCGLVKATNGYATDIRARDPACLKWTSTEKP